MTKPKQRNAILTCVAPMLPAVFVEVLAASTGLAMFDHALPWAIFAGVLLALFMLAAMTRELRSITGNQGFSWWPVLIPLYNIYWTAVVLQAEVAKAKAMRAAPEARDSFVYLCCFWWALAEDLNDLAK
jgi:hypothetical protein